MHSATSQEHLKIVISGDVSDWNICDFSPTRIPGPLRGLIVRSDLFIPNLEGPIRLPNSNYRFEILRNRCANELVSRLLSLINKRQPVVYSTPRILDLLSLANNTCVTLANNHTKDLGRKGIEDTISLLRGRDIDFVGAGDNRAEANRMRLLSVRGKDVAVLNYNYVGLRKFGLFVNLYGAARNFAGAAYLSPKAIRTEIEHVRSRAPDAFVVLIVHGGRALAPTIAATEIDYERFATLGAHCVVFHHSHRYFSVPSDRCFFLGDFVFAHPGSLPEDREGALVEIDLDSKTNTYDSKIHRYRFGGGYPRGS
jgi:poly-gamma-glutamate capsule biosynthesis protein CapA/YwtB (metallophosphatase superfamily)